MLSRCARKKTSISGLATVWLLLAMGCNSEAENSSASGDVSAKDVASDTVSGSVKDVLAAVQTPLEDINLKREKIPPKLKEISKNPYLLPVPLQCKNIQKEIQELNTLLGHDVDAVIVIAENGKTKYIEEGQSIVRQQAASMAYSQVDVIPVRGIVRKITGAERHAKRLAKAYEAGKLRRAYLKGIGSALHCENGKVP